MAYLATIEDKKLVLKAAGVKKVIPADDVSYVQSSWNSSYIFILIAAVLLLFIAIATSNLVIWSIFGMTTLVALIGNKKILIVETKGGSRFRCNTKGTVTEVIDEFEEMMDDDTELVTSSSSVEIEKLHDLMTKGIITKDEFAAKKEQLLK